MTTCMPGTLILDTLSGQIRFRRQLRRKVRQYRLPRRFRAALAFGLFDRLAGHLGDLPPRISPRAPRGGRHRRAD